MAKTKDALKIIDAMVGDDPDLRQMIAEESVNAAVAQMICDARAEAGLTQKELADRIGTRQPVIARLEDAEYKGHSLSMLTRIAEALNRSLRVRRDSEESSQTTAWPTRQFRAAFERLSDCRAGRMLRLLADIAFLCAAGWR